MSLVTLTSGRLSVVLARAGTDYTAARFDWTSQVRQLTLDGTNFLTRENVAQADAEGQGVGLASEWGIDRPVGYDDCAVYDWFPKIGVGLLQRRDDRPYHFFRFHPVRPAECRTSVTTHRATVVQHQAEYRGFGWRLTRDWSLDDDELCLTTTLENTGRRPLSTSEYSHNFVGLGQAAVDDAWSLQLDVALDPPGWSARVEADGLWAIEGATLRWTKAARGEFFFSRRQRPAPTTWTLRHDGGAWMSEQTSFTPTHLNLWGTGHVVSPELFWDVDVEPGQAVSSTRLWRVGQE